VGIAHGSRINMMFHAEGVKYCSTLSGSMPVWFELSGGVATGY
jgi:hypothetical protein